jgi:signal transduction histidine kinase
LVGEPADPRRVDVQELATGSAIPNAGPARRVSRRDASETVHWSQRVCGLERERRITHPRSPFIVDGLTKYKVPRSQSGCGAAAPAEIHGIVLDLTDLKTAALGNLSSQGGAESANRARAPRGMSHEIRTPMNGVLGMTISADTQLNACSATTQRPSATRRF